MTFSVRLSLFIYSQSNRLAEGQFCLRAVHPIRVVSLNVSHHLFRMSDTTFSPLRPRVPLIPLSCFEHNLARAHHGRAGKTDIYKQAKGNIIMLLTPALEPEAPGWLQTSTLPFLALFSKLLHQLRIYLYFQMCRFKMHINNSNSHVLCPCFQMI